MTNENQEPLEDKSGPCMICTGTLKTHDVGCVDPLIRMETCEAFAELIATSLGIVCLGHNSKDNYIAIWPIKATESHEEQFAMATSSKSLTNAILSAIGLAQERQDIFYSLEEAQIRVATIIDKDQDDAV